MAELAALGVAAASTAASSAPAWLPYATAAATAGLGYTSAQRSASIAKQTGEYNAKELERGAADERAAGVRKAQEQRLKNEVVMSRQRAAAAKSGAGTSEGEGYLDLVDDTAQRGQYLSDLDISMGENAAAGLQAKAAMSRAKGSAEAGSYRMKSYAALVEGAGSMANTAIKRRPMAASSDGYDDLIDFDANDAGWSTEVYRNKSRGRYY